MEFLIYVGGALKPQRGVYMSRKTSLVLFFVVVFGLFATTSLFANQPPPTGVWENRYIGSRFTHTNLGQVRLSHNIAGGWVIGLYDMDRRSIGQINATSSSVDGNTYTILFNRGGQTWVIHHGGVVNPGFIRVFISGRPADGFRRL